MTLNFNLKITKILTLISLAFIFSIAYLTLTSNSFAQAPTPTSIKQEKRQERMELAQAKRTAQQIKICQKQEKNINNRLTSLTNLVDNMITKFDAIAARTENRYATKLLPQGKTISNYNSLVTDISAKKTTLTTDVAKANSDIAGFSCTSASDPKTNLTIYRTDMQTVKTVLQNYRKSIRNLIVAVATASGEKLESPEPSKSPEATK